MKTFKKVFFTGYSLLTVAALLSLVWTVLVKQNTDFNTEDAMTKDYNIYVLCGLFVICCLVSFLSIKKTVELYK